MKDGAFHGRLTVLEPSKVGPQHITLIEGYLEGLLALDLRSRGLELVYQADPSSYAALSDHVRTHVLHIPIAVTNPEMRRWIRKCLEEVAHVRKTVASMGPQDILLVTCLSAPSLLILELGNWLIGEKRVTAVLHSELEALYDPHLRSPKSWGFWSHLWSQVRKPSSRLGIAVIASFIRDALEKSFPRTFSAGSVRVLPFPIVKVDAAPAAVERHRISFIGYKTRFKGFAEFESMAQRFEGSDCDFVVIGSGVVESVPSGEKRPFAEGAGFLGEVGASSVAVFPYQQGYVVTMSAAAIDTIATGVQLLATSRPCFEALADEFGTEFVTLYKSPDALFGLLSDTAFLDRARAGTTFRRANLERSCYSRKAIVEAFDSMLTGFGYPVAGADIAAKERA